MPLKQYTIGDTPVDVGDQVRVRNGPFADWVGIIDGLMTGRFLLVFPVMGTGMSIGEVSLNRGLERIWFKAEDLEILETPEILK